MSSTGNEDDVSTRAQAIRKLHRLLLLYPDGIEVSMLEKLYSEKYPEMTDVEIVGNFLSAVEGRLVKIQSVEGASQFRICYPMPFSGFSSAKIYARYFEDIGEQAGGLTYQIRLASVCSSSSFAIYLPHRAPDFLEMNRMMKDCFYDRGRHERAGCIEQGFHYAYEDVGDPSVCRYKRVRVDYISEPEDFCETDGGEEKNVHCTRIDFGGDIALSPEDLLRLPRRLNPDIVLLGDYHMGLEFRHYPYAVKCIIPLESEVGERPQSRQQLYYALTGNSSDANGDHPLMKVHFVRYVEGSCAFIAYPVRANGRRLPNFGQNKMEE